MKRYNLIVVGAGPAGLSAAIEAAKHGMSVMVFDENHKPGGQLFKQIHKFFGSKEHKAKVRGFNIGYELLKEASDIGVEVKLDATVTGIFENKEVTVSHDGAIHHYKADSVIIATGAAENMVPFEGWTLPGVIGAGAAQTLMNLHGVKPGKKTVDYLDDIIVHTSARWVNNHYIGTAMLLYKLICQFRSLCKDFRINGNFKIHSFSCQFGIAVILRESKRQINGRTDFLTDQAFFKPINKLTGSNNQLLSLSSSSFKSYAGIRKSSFVVNI